VAFSTDQAAACPIRIASLRQARQRQTRTIAVSAASISAVMDALRPFKVRLTEMPNTF